MSQDLNKIIADVQKDGNHIEAQLKALYGKYDNLFRESNRQLNQERSVIGSMKGLEDFYHLTQLIRRNRDVTGSLLRGFTNLRSLNGFKFVEEDIPEPKPKKKKKMAAEAIELPPEIQTTETPEVEAPNA
jgi:hypothetical protein